MRAIPITDEMAEAIGGERVVIGPPLGIDPIGDIRPVEAVRCAQAIEAGGPAMPVLRCLMVLEDDDLDKLTEGHQVVVSFWGGTMVPWDVQVLNRKL